MPVEHSYTIRAGATSQLLLFFAARSGPSGEGARGLRHDAAGAVAAYLREGDSSARAVALTAGRLGHWTPGGLAEADPELMPGVYQFGAPDEMLAPGSTRVLLLLQLPGARIAPIEISLVAYDPQDSERIGVTSLANDQRHQFLRRAMPRLTELDLVLGERAEGELRRALTDRKDP